jgi:PIN domain nuclease of toxin-antitoxin system
VKFLLDTHLVLWWLSNHPLLPTEARQLIGDPGNTIFVSAVSVWEVWLKSSIGKLVVPSGFAEKLAAEPFADLPLSAAHTPALAMLEWHHRDPFDRILIAQAKSENLVLLTVNKKLSAYGQMVRVAAN